MTLRLLLPLMLGFGALILTGMRLQQRHEAVMQEARLRAEPGAGVAVPGDPRRAGVTAVDDPVLAFFNSPLGAVWGSRSAWLLGCSSSCRSSGG